MPSKAVTALPGVFIFSCAFGARGGWSAWLCWDRLMRQHVSGDWVIRAGLAPCSCTERPAHNPLHSCPLSTWLWVLVLSVPVLHTELMEFSWLGWYPSTRCSLLGTRGTPRPFCCPTCAAHCCGLSWCIRACCSLGCSACDGCGAASLQVPLGKFAYLDDNRARDGIASLWAKHCTCDVRCHQGLLPG